MKVCNESLLQLAIAVLTIIGSAFVPEIRYFLVSLFRNIPALLIVVGIVAIFYLQTRKMVKKSQKSFVEKEEAKEQSFTSALATWQSQYDERVRNLDKRIEHQCVLIDNIIKTNSLHLSLTKKSILPFIYRDHKEEVIKTMYYNNIPIQALQENGFEGEMITEYQKFYHQKEVERYSSK